MIDATRKTIQRWLDHLLHIHDSPQRTAAAYALGVFFGFSPLPPFLGLHTGLALAFAFVFNLNRVAVLIGVYSNLPWILAPYYTLTTMMGAKILGMHLPESFAAHLEHLFGLSVFHAEFWRRLVDLLRPFVWPFALGSLIGASVLALVAYKVALAFVIARRRHPHLLRELQKEIHLKEIHIHHRHPPAADDQPPGGRKEAGRETGSRAGDRAGSAPPPGGQGSGPGKHTGNQGSGTKD